MKYNWQTIMIKIDRIAAWVLFVAMIIYAISGYGMTKGIFDPALARNLHLNWLAPLALLSFVVHTSWAIYLAFRRWNLWNLFSKAILFLGYFSLIFGLIYLDRFYVRDNKPINQQIVNQQTNSDPIISASTSSQPQVSRQITKQQTSQSSFTLTELKKYDGRNGNPAYVAVNGLVYDLSSIFVDGYHQGFSAGQDLTVEFYNQHDSSFLNSFKIVGKLIK
jgi:predicted heme/steroid binding protein